MKKKRMIFYLVAIAIIGGMVISFHVFIHYFFPMEKLPKALTKVAVINNLPEENVYFDQVRFHIISDRDIVNVKPLFKVWRDNRIAITSPPFDLNELGNITNIHFLDIEKNNSFFNFRDLSKFSKLRMLKLSEINLEDLQTLPELEALEYLSLEAAEKIILPENFLYKFPNLSTLRLENVSLASPSSMDAPYVSKEKFHLILDGDRAEQNLSNFNIATVSTLQLQNASIDMEKIRNFSWDKLQHIYISDTTLYNAEYIFDMNSNPYLAIMDTEFIFENGEKKNIKQYFGNLKDFNQ